VFVEKGIKMHEMSITISMMETVKHSMIEHGLKQLKRLRIRVGALTAVEPQSLIFCFEIYVQGTPMEGATLEIENMPLMSKCRGCKKEFRIDEFYYDCPYCNSSSVENISGHELDIVSMEGE
jgi:hydrogenase nickel incorporation protein HypA/HybF